MSTKPGRGATPHRVFVDASAEVAADGGLPFNRPYLTGAEWQYMREAAARGHLAGGGAFAARCNRWLEEWAGCQLALVTNAGTAALELAATLLDIRRGDEVVMPSFTFVTTANVFAARGATPVFVDIRPDTLTVDEQLLERAITPRTKAVVPVHYAGVSSDLDAIVATAERYRIAIVEDAAHAILASFRGRPLGSFGALATLSFHETKNVMCGEGGALLVNRARLVERAQIIYDKGTNRSAFLRGEVDRYSWVDLGSSYELSDLNAAFLWAQLEAAQRITAERLELWSHYHDVLEALEEQGKLRRPVVPRDSGHNGHMYYVVLAEDADRGQVLERLASRGVNAVFHYVPLHSSPAGRRYGRAADALPVTEDVSKRLIRLPLWAGMREGDVHRVAEALRDAM